MENSIEIVRYVCMSIFMSSLKNTSHCVPSIRTNTRADVSTYVGRWRGGYMYAEPIYGTHEISY